MGISILMGKSTCSWAQHILVRQIPMFFPGLPPHWFCSSELNYSIMAGIFLVALSVLLRGLSPVAVHMVILPIFSFGACPLFSAHPVFLPVFVQGSWCAGLPACLLCLGVSKNKWWCLPASWSVNLGVQVCLHGRCPGFIGSLLGHVPVSAHPVFLPVFRTG